MDINRPSYKSGVNTHFALRSWSRISISKVRSFLTCIRASNAKAIDLFVWYAIACAFTFAPLPKASLVLSCHIPVSLMLCFLAKVNFNLSNANLGSRILERL